MNKNLIKILIPVVAIAVIVESLLLFTKANPQTTGPVALPTSVEQQSTTLQWQEINKNEVALMLSSDKDVAVDAVDLYIKYDPSMVVIKSATVNKGFVTPSFKKINPEKGLVVMNFLVSEASGFKLKAGLNVELARLTVEYSKNGTTEFSLGEGTLVVENATAKVLPFNSEKLVINVTQ